MKSAVLRTRVTQPIAALAFKAAQSSGMSISEWLRSLIARAVK